MINLMKHKNMTNHEIQSRISAIKKIYFIILLIVALVLLITISETDLAFSEKVGKLMLSIIICGSIYLGLRMKRRWVIPLILIFSALGCLNSFLRILVPVDNISSLFAKIVGILFLVFFVYQLYFFTCQNVKQYFGFKGRIFF